MTEVSAAQTNKKRHAGVVVPYGHERTLTVGAAISRPPTTQRYPIGRLIAAPTDSPFTIHYTLFTIHCSLFTIHCLLDAPGGNL